MLEEVKRSNLRGRGGAGFTTGIKWEACRHATGLAHYVVCNADEGEPGTFKDRVLLTSHADLVFDGMTVAAYCIGASQGFLYLRGEYERARFYVRRLNLRQETSNAQSLWLAVRIEHRMGNRGGVEEWGRQLRARFPQAPQTLAFERGQFDD